MNSSDKVIKRLFDILFALFLLVLFFWLIIILVVLSTIDTRKMGVFYQNRVGKNALLFKIFKIRTMRSSSNILTTVTASNDTRITAFGKLLRRYKLDELPQLFNVLKGDMSFVGPRPDVQGFADQLYGEDREVLTIRPGVTGPASIFFRYEERVLGEEQNPEKYNKEVIWPKKILINRKYIKEYSFRKDIYYIVQTLLKI